MIFDAVSGVGGDNLGRVIKYANKEFHDPLDLKYHHSLTRFEELKL
ncbi:hypothetical protein AAHB64_00540 [Bacillus toyonensis]